MAPASGSRREAYSGLTNPASSERILVVDGEPAARQELCALLRAQGFAVWEAADGEEGLQLLQKLNPAAVLCDLRTPKVDGLALIQRGRALKNGARFILMSPPVISDEGRAMLRGGVGSYLTKPLDQRVLMWAVEGALEPG